MSAERFLPESLGPGCAFLDYDNDGWMDIYLVNSGPSNFFQPKQPLKNALYRNNRDGTFTDVTDKAGVAGGTFGMGVAVGDYNNDGFPDMFVTAYGRSILYRNNKDGTFTDVTEKAGLASGMPGWTTGAVWFDYDNDGLLDLFVGSYVEYDLRQGLLCAEKKKDGSLYYHYCIPHLFKPTASVLWHNNGDGTFTPVEPRHRHRTHARQSARRRRDRHQQRRPDGSGGGQRHRAQSSCSSTRGRTCGARMVSPRESRIAPRATFARAWASTRRI